MNPELEILLKRGNRDGDVRVKKDVEKKLKRLARNVPLAAYVRRVVLEYIDEHPLKTLPPPPPESALPALKETRPGALVYTVPVNGAKIVASVDPDGGWRGIVFNPQKTDSTSTWATSRLNPPLWASTPLLLKTMVFIASRLDNDGLCYFEVPRTGYKISAKWDEEDRRFNGGEIIDPSTKRRQDWFREGWYAHMSEGPFTYLANIRRLVNMLCRTITVGDGGLDARVPLH